MDLEIFLNILTIVLSALVAGFIYGRNPKSPTTKSLLVLIGSFIVWALTQIIIYLNADNEIVLLVHRFAHLLGIVIAWTFVWFTYHFLHSSVHLNRLLMLVGGALSILVVALGFLPNGTIKGIYQTAHGAAFMYNSMYLGLWTIIFCLISFYGFYILYLKYNASSGESKWLIAMIFILTLIPFVAGFIFNVLFLLLGIFHFQIYGPIFTLIFTFGITYILLRSSKT